MVEHDREPTASESSEREASPSVAPVTKLPGHVPGDVRDVSFHSSVRGYERREVDRYVQRVNRVIAELEIARSPESAVRHALDRAEEQTSGILHRARETADEIIHTARSEAEDTIERGRAEAREIVTNARSEADGIVANAEQAARERVGQGERELASAREQAEDARADADTTIADARSQASQIVAKAESEAEEIVTRTDAQAIERRAQEEQRLEEIRRKAERELQALRAHTDGIAEERRGLIEEIHELAVRLEAVADVSATDATRESSSTEGGPARPSEGRSDGGRGHEPTLGASQEESEA